MDCQLTGLGEPGLRFGAFLFSKCFGCAGSSQVGVCLSCRFGVAGPFSFCFSLALCRCCSFGCFPRLRSFNLRCRLCDEELLYGNSRNG